MENFPIIDADGHVTESNESLRKHLKKEYRNRPLMRSEAWDRSFGGTLGKRNEEPKTQLADMDVEGIDVQVIFPSHLGLLRLGTFPDGPLGRRVREAGFTGSAALEEKTERVHD